MIIWRRREKALTLIELLVSLAIIAIMVAVALPLFSRFRNQNNLSNDAKALAQLFDYARSLQNNPDSQTRINSGGNYNYQIVIDLAGKSATIYSSYKVGGNEYKNQIDKLNFNQNETLGISADGATVSNSSDFPVILAGKSPTETIDCPVKTCNSFAEITFESSGVTKNLKVFNTAVVAGQTNQLFKIVVQ